MTPGPPSDPATPPPPPPLRLPSPVAPPVPQRLCGAAPSRPPVARLPRGLPSPLPVSVHARTRAALHHRPRQRRRGAQRAIEPPRHFPGAAFVRGHGHGNRRSGLRPAEDVRRQLRRVIGGDDGAVGVSGIDERTLSACAAAPRTSAVAAST